MKIIERRVRMDKAKWRKIESSIWQRETRNEKLICYSCKQAIGRGSFSICSRCSFALLLFALWQITGTKANCEKCNSRVSTTKYCAGGAKRCKVVVGLLKHSDSCVHNKKSRAINSSLKWFQCLLQQCFVVTGCCDNSLEFYWTTLCGLWRERAIRKPLITHNHFAGRVTGSFVSAWIINKRFV